MTIDDDNYTPEKGLPLSSDQEPCALLVGVFRTSHEKQYCLEYLRELRSLAETFGVAESVDLPLQMRNYEAATYVSQGKVSFIQEAIAEHKITLVIFDDEISPAQQRNLEEALKRPVMDRTELILEIFAQRAHTKEAKLQIELARTKYQFPRLKRLWGHLSRQRASGGYLRGEGEQQLEIDKRLLQRKIDRLTEELEEVKNYRQTQLQARRRSGIPTFALIGYTNAGKSTLLNALTDSQVFVEDKLFATLDPTTRKLLLPNNESVLLTDTVGFIRKLPHTLVAAFKSTLESALYDDILLHVIDVSHPMAEEQASTTRELLEELKVEERPVITLLNKIDLCTDSQRLERLLLKYPKVVKVSATTREGFEELFQRMIQELQERRCLVKLRVPQKEYAIVSEIRRLGRVIYEEYEENDVIIKAEVPTALLGRLKSYQIS